MAQGAVIGLAAHVDAGKTTLSEAMLYLSGAVRRQGRVDHGDAYLDHGLLEAERGITIFSKEARLLWKKTDLTLIDTPGHTDFAGETERAMSVMDAAVLIVSAPDGVQPHTRTLWKLLEQHGIPVVLFFNKMDRSADSREALIAKLAELTDRAVDFTENPDEQIALCDETCLDLYLREGSVPARRMYALFRERKLFPCFFGAALQNEGVPELLDFLAGYDPGVVYPSAFGARVYKIARDPQGARLTFVRVTGGTLQPRDLLTGFSNGEPWSEKAAEIRLYSGARYTAVPRAEAGQLCCVTGLTRAMPGSGLGTEADSAALSQVPCFTCRVVPEAGGDLHKLLDCLRLLEEEEPLLKVDFSENTREIRIQSMGEIYLDVLRQQLAGRFGLTVSFTDSSVLYHETIAAPVEGVGHYEPLRHYAEVHLLLSPLPRGSGLVFDSDISTDDLALNWQRLILTHLAERTHRGVLTGAPITDMRVTLVNGRAHLKHTEGGDFRQATYRALRQGLMKAESVLLEPWVTVDITAPAEHLGKVMNDLSRLGGKPESPGAGEPGFGTLRAALPAAACESYRREFRAFTRGRGRFTVSFLANLPCADAEKVIAEKEYDPLRDVWNTPDSVFCSHGAGVTVPWDQVEQYMHLPLRQDASRPDASSPRAVGSFSRAYTGTREEDEALRLIFEKTYGPAKSRRLLAPSPPAVLETPEAAPPPPSWEGEILLVDGYNVLYAWEEWKDLLRDSFDAARRQLSDLLCDFAGMTGKEVILVFDAYKVRGNPGSAEKYRNIYVIYTREAQTADAYIEKVTLLARSRTRLRVVTSDRPEQLIALGNTALRTSAREFHEEVTRVRGSISDFLAKNYRPGGERALERLYKEAWKARQAAEKPEAASKP